MLRKPLTGILPVLPTPFKDNGDVDESAMRRLVRFSINLGTAGAVFPGFASEVEFLSVDERAELLKVVADEAQGKIALVAGASANTVSEVIEHGKTARRLGINFVMIQPAKCEGSEPVAVIEYLAKISASLPDATIILQNAPVPRGSDLSLECISEIVRSVDQVAYVKEETLPTGPAISYILASGGGQLDGVIGGGGGRYIIDEYSRGACAAMPAIELADMHIALDAAWRAGNRGQARKIYMRTLPLLTLQAVYRMRLTKHVMMRRGVLENAVVRAPTPDLDQIAIREIEENLALLGLSTVSSGKQGSKK